MFLKIEFSLRAWKRGLGWGGGEKIRLIIGEENQEKNKKGRGGGANKREKKISG